jgi:hypothetical protein
MHSVTNSLPVAKVSSQAVIATSRRPIIGATISSYPPRVALSPSKINITSSKVATSQR